MDMIIDLETLGVKRRDVVLLSFAAVPFNIDDADTFQGLVNKGFYRKLNVLDQLKTHSSTTEEMTVKWWKEQSPECRSLSYIPSDEDCLIEQAMKEFSKWVSDNGYDFEKSFVWSRGIAFDMPKIEYWLDKFNLKPLNFWKARDIRTMIDVLTGSTNGIYPVNTPVEFIKHHCLHDCAMDAYTMQKIYHKLMEE